MNNFNTNEFSKGISEELVNRHTIRDQQLKQHYDDLSQIIAIALSKYHREFNQDEIDY